MLHQRPVENTLILRWFHRYNIRKRPFLHVYLHRAVPEWLKHREESQYIGTIESAVCFRRLLFAASHFSQNSALKGLPRETLCPPWGRFSFERAAGSAPHPVP